MPRKPTKLPWSIYAADATEAARYLIAQAGGVGAAKDAVSRAAKAMKKPRGRPPQNDTHLLLIARAVEKDSGCSRSSALMQAAQLFVRDQDAAKSIARRLLNKLDGKSLASFARHQPLEATRRTDGFAFRLRK